MVYMAHLRMVYMAHLRTVYMAHLRMVYMAQHELVLTSFLHVLKIDDLVNVYWY